MKPITIKDICWWVCCIACIIFLLYVQSACGHKRDSEDPEPDNRITAEQIASLGQLSTAAHAWAPRCAGNIACEEGSDGDSMLWAGLLCLSGETDQCAAAFASQRSDGMVCRAPDLLELDENASSRDMLLGWIAAVVATKNQGAALSFQDFIYSNNLKLCDNATDNRCDMSLPIHSAAWATLGLVWKFIGLETTDEMKLGNLLGDETIIRVEAFSSPRGFGLHLVAVELLIRQKVGAWTAGLQKAAMSLATREPSNPFFEYIAHGKTRRAADLVLQQCPTERPESAHQWAWQRASAEQAWKSSMGWDCIFMANILTR